MVGVAQLVEHWVVAPVVEGSSPFTHPINGIKRVSKRIPIFYKCSAMNVSILFGLLDRLQALIHLRSLLKLIVFFSSPALLIMREKHGDMVLAVKYQKLDGS